MTIPADQPLARHIATAAEKYNTFNGFGSNAA
jgi:hypothetical protein